MDLEIFGTKFPVETDRDQLEAILIWADHFEGSGEWPGIFNGFPYYLSPGELFDRYTIMTIKAKRLSDRAKAKMMSRRSLKLIHGLFPPDVNFSSTRHQEWLASVKLAANQLQQVNDALWRVEDHLRDAEMAVYPVDAKPPSLEDWDLAADPPKEKTEPQLTGSPEKPNLPHILRFARLSRMVCRLNRLRMLVKKRIDELFAQMPEPKDYRGELEE